MGKGTIRRWMIARRIRRVLSNTPLRHRCAQTASILMEKVRVSRGEYGEPYQTLTIQDLMPSFWNTSFQALTPIPTEPAPKKTPTTPGRQPIALGSTGEGLFGFPSTWRPPFPPHAQTALWEDVHRFAPGCKPTRHSHFGLERMEPAIALVCMGCELEQAPLTSGDRTCGYCGLRMKPHGSRVYWWREAAPEVPEWTPQAKRAQR